MHADMHLSEIRLIDDSKVDHYQNGCQVEY
jgi:hypothetical protein